MLLTAALLLLIPFIAMQFSDEVHWTAVDFAVAGVLLLGTGLGIELIRGKVKNPNYRIAMIGALLLVFLLIWAELAVGILGTPIGGH